MPRILAPIVTLGVFICTLWNFVGQYHEYTETEPRTGALEALSFWTA